MLWAMLQRLDSRGWRASSAPSTQLKVDRRRCALCWRPRLLLWPAWRAWDCLRQSRVLQKCNQTAGCCGVAWGGPSKFVAFRVWSLGSFSAFDDWECQVGDVDVFPTICRETLVVWMENWYQTRVGHGCNAAKQVHYFVVSHNAGLNAQPGLNGTVNSRIALLTCPLAVCTQRFNKPVLGSLAALAVLFVTRITEHPESAHMEAKIVVVCACSWVAKWCITGARNECDGAVEWIATDVYESLPAPVAGVSGRFILSVCLQKRRLQSPQKQGRWQRWLLFSPIGQPFGWLSSFVSG